MEPEGSAEQKCQKHVTRVVRNKFKQYVKLVLSYEFTIQFDMKPGSWEKQKSLKHVTSDKKIMLCERQTHTHTHTHTHTQTHTYICIYIKLFNSVAILVAWFMEPESLMPHSQEL